MKSESGEESMEHEVFSGKLIVATVLVGILMIFVAELAIIWSDWENTEAMKIAVRTASTLIGLGGMISSVALIGGAVLNKSVDKFVRLGMLIVAGFLLMQAMPLATTYLWSFL